MTRVGLEDAALPVRTFRHAIENQKPFTAKAGPEFWANNSKQSFVFSRTPICTLGPDHRPWLGKRPTDFCISGRLKTNQMPTWNIISEYQL